MNTPLVIAITNRKGGSGKTTTAVNLAYEWGKSGFKTLLIDLDTQGHAGIGVGCSELNNSDGTVHDIFFQSPPTLMSIIHKTPLNNVWLAPANTEFMSEQLNPLCLRKALRLEKGIQEFQRIIVDTPPALDNLLVNGLVATQGIIIPFMPHHLAKVGARQLAKLFYQITTNYNSDLKLLGLLPIMYDKHIKLHQRVLKELSDCFGRQRILRGIRSNIKLAEAFEAGMPVSNYASHSMGSMDYQLMAQELESFLTFKECHEIPHP